MIPSKPPKEIKQIAMDMAEGKVFTSNHIPEDQIDMLPKIFMVIALGGIHPEHTKNLGMIYEYISEAAPMAINGFPSFFSHKMLNRSDTTKLWELYNKYVKMKSEFIGETT